MACIHTSNHFKLGFFPKDSVKLYSLEFLHSDTVWVINLGPNRHKGNIMVCGTGKMQAEA